MVKMFTILLIAFSAMNLANGEDPCPPDDDIYPCYCFFEEERDLLPEISCERVEDIGEIKKVLQTLKGKGFTLALKKIKFGEIPSDFFKGASVPEVEFIECSITSFGEVILSGLEDSVEAITIVRSYHEPNTKSKPLKMDHLRKLKSVYIQENVIRRVGNDWFANGPTSLEEVNLELNNIPEFGDKVFAQLVNVRQIWMHGNPLKQVFRSMFPNPAPELQVLMMGLAEISFLPEDMFEGMPALRDISLQQNKLVTLPENTWKPIWKQLNNLFFDYNKLFVCDKRIRWIYEIGRLPRRVFKGTCYGNNALTGKKLANLTLSDFD